MSELRDHEIVSGPVRMFLAEGLALPSGLITLGYLGRVFGPEGFGHFTIVVAVAGLVEAIVGSLLADAANKAVSDSHDWRGIGKTVVRMFLVVSVAAAACMALMARPTAAWLGEPQLTTYLLLFALDVPAFGLACAHRIVLVGTGRFSACANAIAGRWLARLLLVVLFVRVSATLEAAILAVAASSLIELAIARLYVRPALGGRLSQPVRPLAKLMMPLFLVSVAVLLLANVDLLMLKAAGAAAKDVGLYGGAQRLSLAASVLVLAFAPILLSTLVRALRDGQLEAAKRLARLALGAALLLVPFAGMIAGAGGEVMALVLGSDFAAAGPLLAALLLAAVLRVVLSFGVIIVVAAGWLAWTYLISLFLVPLAIAAYALIIPATGAPGAAAVTFAVSLAGAAIMLLGVYRTWSVLPPTSMLVGSAALCVVGYAASAAWPAGGVLLLVKMAVVGSVLAVALYGLGTFDLAEIRSLRRSLATRLVDTGSDA